MAIAITETVGRDGVIRAAFRQDAIGTNDLVAAPAADGRIIVVGLILTLAAVGSARLEDGDGDDLLGTVDLAAGIPLVWRGNVRSPLVEVEKGKKLQIVTAGTGALAGGELLYKIAP